MGSCFVENIGAKLEYFKFQNLQNPFGILFHPLAIEKLIIRALETDYFTEEDVFFFQEQWHCFEVHSVLSNSNKEALITQLNLKLKSLKEYLENASHIVFTYGTSWVYKHNESNTVVANCYKIPQKNFTKKLLLVEKISASINNTLAKIKKVNPKVTFILTVSPVRHLKDGFVENTVSKSHLVSVIYNITKGNRSLSGVEMFPSYEIMMDELRDYRFYKEDMIHPNSTAIQIIWEAFNETWISSETQSLQKEIASIQTSFQHRPFHPESEEHQLFLKKLNAKIGTLQKKIKHLKF